MNQRLFISLWHVLSLGEARHLTKSYSAPLMPMRTRSMYIHPSDGGSGIYVLRRSYFCVIYPGTFRMAPSLQSHQIHIRRPRASQYLSYPRMALYVNGHGHVPSKRTVLSATLLCNPASAASIRDCYRVHGFSEPLRIRLLNIQEG